MNFKLQETPKYYKVIEFKKLPSVDLILYSYYINKKQNPDFLRDWCVYRLTGQSINVFSAIDGLGDEISTTIRLNEITYIVSYYNWEWQ